MSRVVLIPGCPSGFGLAMIPEFVARGWRVVATARGGGERLAPMLAELHVDPSMVEVRELDVTDAAQRVAVAASLPRLDCLVNKAGWGRFGPFEESSEAQIRAIFETDFFGAALLTKACLPLLRASRGRIINISSVFGFSGF